MKRNDKDQCDTENNKRHDFPQHNICAVYYFIIAVVLLVLKGVLDPGRLTMIWHNHKFAINNNKRAVVVETMESE